MRLHIHDFALFALPDAIKQGTYFIIVWLSSSFLQLVLLPIIIVGQNIQAAASDKRAEETYKDAEAVLKESEEIQKHLLAQDEVISAIMARLLAMAGGDPTPPSLRSLALPPVRESVGTSRSRSARRPLGRPGGKVPRTG